MTLNKPRKEMNPFAPPSDLRTFCVFHGPQNAGHCTACDEEAGFDREAESHAAEREALLKRLGELGVTPAGFRAMFGTPSTVVSDERGAMSTQGGPAPNESVPVQSDEEQIAELEARLKELRGGA